MTANVLTVVLSFLLGVVSLFPARRTLGPWLTHLAALPVGMIGWSMVAALTTVLHTPPGAASVVVGLALYVGVVFGTCMMLRGRAQYKVGWRSYLIAGLVFATSVAFFAALGRTIVSFDSYAHYEISGWYLFDTGQLSWTIMNARGPLVPALHMANRLFGSDWLSLLYPLVSLDTLALLVFALWEHAFARLSRTVRIAATALVTAMVAVSPAWVFHTWHVHSNMVSCMYLTLAVVGILAGAGIFRRSSEDTVPSSAGILAGLATVGLVLARPDGPAYAFLGLALLAVCHILGRVDRRMVRDVYASLLPLLLIIFGAAIWRIGLWPGPKLSGRTAIAMLAALAVFGVVTLLVPRVEPLAAFVDRVGVFRLAAIVNVVAIVAVALKMRSQFVLTVRNMGVDLLLKGGWGLTWWALVLCLVLSVVFWVRGEGVQERQLLLYVALQFLGIALVVFGVMAPGITKYMDSFNRLALHIVPVAVWYLAAWAGSLAVPAIESVDP